MAKSWTGDLTDAVQHSFPICVCFISNTYIYITIYIYLSLFNIYYIYITIYQISWIHTHIYISHTYIHTHIYICVCIVHISRPEGIPMPRTASPMTKKDGLGLGLPSFPFSAEVRQALAQNMTWWRLIYRFKHFLDHLKVGKYHVKYMDKHYMVNNGKYMVMS